jgi:hypothetical protein
MLNAPYKSHTDPLVAKIASFKFVDQYHLNVSKFASQLIEGEAPQGVISSFRIIRPDENSRHRKCVTLFVPTGCATIPFQLFLMRSLNSTKIRVCNFWKSISRLTQFVNSKNWTASRKNATHVTGLNFEILNVYIITFTTRLPVRNSHLTRLIS